MSQDNPKYLLLGEIVRPHGVRGELKMRVLTDYPERIAQLKAVYLATDPNAKRPARYTVSGLRMHQRDALLTLKQVEDRNQAELLRGMYVMVDVRDAVPLADDELYLYQLIGMEVRTVEGESLGQITDVLETGANDVYIVQGTAYGEVLIPVTDETIIKTDTDSGIVTVKLPEGLLPNRK